MNIQIFRERIGKGWYILSLSLIVAILATSLVAQQGNAGGQGKNQDDKLKKGDNTFSEYDKVKGWRIRDFKPYIKAFADLELLSDERSLMILQQAKDDYNFGIGILQNMESDIIKFKEAAKDAKNLEERWYWQVIDRKNREQRIINRKKREAKMKSVTYFTKAIHRLDRVQNNKVRAGNDFQNFQGNLYKVYVSTQYDLGNFAPCIPILNRYIKIRKENEKDIWAHRYLASCYAFQEKVLMISHNSPESTILRYRKLKNDHLLEAAKLKYPDPESPERKQIFQIISEDSINTAPINNYK